MDRTLWLVEQAHQGDKRAREQAIEENMGLVYSVVKRFAGRGTELEDLIQIGSIGLIKAIDNFDTGYDVKFSTYAVPMISGEVKRFLRDDGLLKVSRSMKAVACQTSKVREELMNQNGYEPTLEEISKASGIPREEIVFAMEAVSEVESLQKSVYQKDGNPICLEDHIEEKENAQEQLLNHVMLTEVMDELEPQERMLIELRYFRDYTQTQTARKMNRTQVQISRMEKKILNKMRACINR